MTISIFETRSMIAALRERRKPKMFLTNRFFSAVNQSTTRYVDIDIIKNKRRLAPFVSPMKEGKLVDRERFQTKSIAVPYIKEKMATTAEDLLRRQMGEHIYAPTTPAQRAAAQLTEDLETLQDMIDRRVEWMSAQALFTGQVPVVGEGVNVTIDFSYDANHVITLTAGNLWTDADVNPLEDLRAWKKLVVKDSGITPDIAIFGSDVIDAFLANEAVKAYSDNRRFMNSRTEMTTSGMPDGVTFIGEYEGLMVFGYDEYYLDDAGVEQPMVPVDKVLLGSSKAYTRLQYGAILDVQAGGEVAVPYFPKSWIVEDPSARMLLLQSAPLPTLHQVDAFLVADVI